MLCVHTFSNKLITTTAQKKKHKCLMLHKLCLIVCIKEEDEVVGEINHDVADIVCPMLNT